MLVPLPPGLSLWLIKIMEETDPNKVVVGGVDITEDLKGSLVADAQLEAFNGLKAQKEVASFNDKNRPKWIDGFGQIYLSVSEELYHTCRTMFGPDIWSDPDFQDWVHKEYPEFRVKSESKGLHVPVNGLRDGLVA